MMSVPEAARRVGRNPETVRRWIRQGKLPARKIGTQHFIDAEDLNAVVSQEQPRLPAKWTETITGEPMPDWVAAIHRSRTGR